MSDFFDVNEVKTRKPHECIFCRRVIPAGKTAFNAHGMWDGQWQHWYSCGFCWGNEEISGHDEEEWISGDEFECWASEELATCPSCGEPYAKQKWIGNEQQTLEFTCKKCGHIWNRFIGWAM